jgi:hypothetical protein
MTTSVPCFSAPARTGQPDQVSCCRTDNGCGEGDLQKQECPRADSGEVCARAKLDQDGTDSN